MPILDHNVQILEIIKSTQKMPVGQILSGKDDEIQCGARLDQRRTHGQSSTCAVECRATKIDVVSDTQLLGGSPVSVLWQ